MSKEEVVLELNLFNPKKIKPGSICVFIGKRNTGKTFLTKDLLYHQRDIPYGKIFSPTDALNREYCNMVPKSFIAKNYKSDAMQTIFKTQEEKINKKIEQYKPMYPHLTEKDIIDKYIRTDVKNYAFVLLDDCLADAKNWKNDETIKQIFYNGRHYCIFFLLTMQVVLGIHPNLRAQIDYIFLTFTRSNQEIKKLYECYGGDFRNLEEFKKILNACTEDYNCMVIDNATNSKKFEDKIFYYKAKTHPNFQMMCNNYGNGCNHSNCIAWQYHYKNVRNEQNYRTTINESKNYVHVIKNKKSL